MNPVYHHRTRLVELAGPAGVGKSTLSGVLRRRYAAEHGTIWGLPVLALLGHGAQLVPTLFPLCLQSRSLLWDECRHMVRLKTLQRGLPRIRPGSGPMLIFDEGPIFALAWLRGFGHDSMRSDVAGAWWQATLRQWATALDTVVVLDASDALVAHRIRSRPEWHEIKDASDQQISVWIGRFRSALDWVLTGLALNGGPAVIRIRTDENHPDRIAEQVIAALEAVAHGN
jgi:broad-specificity NMP kinase